MQAFGGETLEKRTVRRPRHRWKCDVKMDLRGMEGLDWITLGSVQYGEFLTS